MKHFVSTRHGLVRVIAVAGAALLVWLIGETREAIEEAREATSWEG